MQTHNAKFYPDHYILLGTPYNQKDDADAIITKAKTFHPEKFEGNEDSFSFEFRYVAPFDKEFAELKRMQGLAAKAAGRRSEFKGYIVIDLSPWLAHHEEEYLNKALLFWIDMSEDWKYIFLINDKNLKAARELAGKVLEAFFHDHIPCKIKETVQKKTHEERIHTLCKEQGLICARPVEELLQKLLDYEFSESIVSALLSELSWNLDKRDTITLNDFAINQEELIRYMLTQTEYNRLMTIIETQKEKWNEEKKAV